MPDHLRAAGPIHKDVHADLGQSVPAPGLVRLGSVDSGPDATASAGNRFTVRIDREGASTRGPGG